jgi:hypothetical protein
VACSVHSNENISELDNQFLTALPITDMNKSLQVVIEDQGSYFEWDTEINLLIYNKSDTSIYFDNNVFVKLFVSSEDNQWIDVENEIEYMGPRLSSPQGTPLLDFEHIVVKPVLDKATISNENRDRLLRIVVIGEIMDGDTHTGQNVAAYADVFLTP